MLHGTRLFLAGIGPSHPSLLLEIPTTSWQCPLLHSQKEKFDYMASATKNEVPRCPYCVSGTGFREMTVLNNGRQICEKCGHIVFPEDRVF